MPKDFSKIVRLFRPTPHFRYAARISLSTKLLPKKGDGAGMTVRIAVLIRSVFSYMRLQFVLIRLTVSEPLYRRALEIFEREYGHEHYEIAVNLNNLAALKQAQGRLDEAERLYCRALWIKEKLLGSEHPDVAMTLNNFAVLSKSLGRYIEAEAMYRRALAIFEQSFEATHPKVITCRKNLGNLLRNMKQNAPQPIRDL